jgi:hypothetical protein
MQRFQDNIVYDKDKVKGHNLYWDTVYTNSYSSFITVEYSIKFEGDWTKVSIDVEHCLLFINDLHFYVETFKFAEDIICSYAIANDLKISESNQDKNTIRKLKIKEILGL